MFLLDQPTSKTIDTGVSQIAGRASANGQMIRDPTLGITTARVPPLAHVVAESVDTCLVTGTFGIGLAQSYDLWNGDAASVDVGDESVGTDADHGPPGHRVQH